MKKNIYFYTNLLAWGLVLFLIGNYVFGWTTPLDDPPLSNLSAPINASSTEQTKTGGFNIATGGGNVGIGTTNPGATLHVMADDSYNAIRLQHSTDNYWDISTIYNITDSDLIFKLGGSEKFRFDAQGNLALGYTTAGTAKLAISGNVGIGTTEPLDALDVRGDIRSRGDSNYALIIEDSAGNDKFVVDTITGTVTAPAFYYSSDESLKENVQEIETPLAKIMKLDGVSFNWKESGEKSIGLIAQDVEKVFPEIVNTNKETGLKSIEYAQLVAPLIEAVKEQQKMIDEQRELIDKQGEEIKMLKDLFKQF